VPDLTLHPWHPDRAALGELTRVAGPLQAATLAAQLGDQGMRLILRSGFGAAAMGTYDLASRAAIAPRSLMASLLVALVPFAAARERSGGTAALSDSLRRSTRYAALMMGTGTIAALAVAAPLMAVWLGEAEGMSDLARQLFVLLLVSLWWQSVLSPMVALGRAVGRPLPEAMVTIVSQPVGLGLAFAAPSAILAVAIMAVVLGAAALVQWLWLKRVLGVEALPSSEIRRLATIALLSGLVALGARGLSEALAWPPLVTLITVPGVILIAAGGFALALGGVSPQERAMLTSMVWRPAR
jgi:O-antigen/teichoic acid export membrane protein